MEYCGMDLHQWHTDVCVLGDDGVVQERARFLTNRERLERFFRGRKPMRVVMEAGGSSPWVARLVESCGHEVLVCNPRNVRVIAESTLKTDERDAETLARLARLDEGVLGSVRPRSEEAQQLRNELKVRGALVETRTKLINTTRGILRAMGYVVHGGSSRKFTGRVRQMELPDELARTVMPLLSQIDSVSEEIGRCEEKLQERVKEMPEVRLLEEIPGVGPIVALYFVASVDDPDRYLSPRNVASFFGLRPVMRSSGKRSYYGRITRHGDPEMRRLLIQAAHALMRSNTRCRLQDWARDLEARKGKAKAMVALARKLAVLMVRLWRAGEVFEPYPNQKAA